ncbi:hypothetical protein M406DRAFT_256838 [Cryphonectria parasitica EP155]|uniref:Amidohydrolase-related domain-containing protein n=1 Tax=Cryphonectria parasitica (strain ATCC 38755 / EP155) TaxID=660469 RepID=A0A9P4Y3B5_CRYP1|nr:uncharacterized protein M406DRAFT_256838 [Cryphonectria parasitica EP155]KAF3765597.1 hypothetical protein M406DRAFT_256838 [Cryphonectria parasitica EP155]
MKNTGHWDTHIHVFDPDAYPYGTPRSYTPKPAHLAEYPFAETTCSNIVIVQATVQGHSAEPLLAALSDEKAKPRDCSVIRGLCTIDPNNASEEELNALHEAGVRGVRLHEVSWGHGTQSGADAVAVKIKAAADRIARLGWVIDVFSDVRSWAAMANMIRHELDPRVKLVADHLGGVFPGEEKLEAFNVFTELVRDGFVYVKLSGFERLYEGHASGMDSLETIVKTLVAAGPERILYGSDIDWPHTQLGVSRKGKTDQQRLTEVEGFREVPDALHIKQLREWITDDEVWRNLWSKNPDRIFA